MPQRSLDLRDLDEAVTEVDRLRARGYDKAGQWDLGQVCNHLAYFMECGLNGADFRVNRLLRALFGRLFFKKILRERRMKSGIQGPSQGMPGPTTDEAAAIERFKQAVTKTKAHVGDFHPSPFFGQATPEQHRELMTIHCAHHLGYLIPKA